MKTERNKVHSQLMSNQYTPGRKQRLNHTKKERTQHRHLLSTLERTKAKPGTEEKKKKHNYHHPILKGTKRFDKQYETNGKNEEEKIFHGNQQYFFSKKKRDHTLNLTLTQTQILIHGL